MNTFAERAESLLGDWPEGGRVVGLLLESSSALRSAERVLDLIETARDRDRPTMVLDLAPEASDLGRRLGFGDRPGLAEVRTGEAELWEVSRRDDDRGLIYVPGGDVSSLDELLGSEAAESLAERSRRRDGLLLVLIPADTAEAAGRSGYVDEWIRVAPAGGERGSADRSPRPDGSEAAERTSREVPPERPEPQLVLPPEMKEPGPRWSRWILITVAALAAAVGLSALLGGPGPADLLDLLPGDRPAGGPQGPSRR